MRRIATMLLVFALVGCAYAGNSSKPSEEQIRQYSAAAVWLPDFSMKIKSYYGSRNLPIPGDFDADKFFALLAEIYPDQSRVASVRDNYRVSVRPVDGGYSVMLCDPGGTRKIMEDLSCHTDHVEIRSWESAAPGACVFESNWKGYCGEE